MYAIGVDIGGMSIKYGVVDDTGTILKESFFKIDKSLNGEQELEKLAVELNQMISDCGLGKCNFMGIGVGCPGQINATTRTCLHSYNLNWHDLPIGDILEKKMFLPVRVTNDANTACLAESYFGKGAGKDIVTCITLGTGIGFGFVYKGKIFEGKDGLGAEFGHEVIKMGGRRCTCGRRGCFETYASATALIKDTKAMMNRHKDSKMWEICDFDIDKAGGRTAFLALDEDKWAKKVVNNYISYLCEGIYDLVNTFRPDIILLGGGISNQDNLIELIQKYIKRHPYYFGDNILTKIDIASLKNKAGIIGAACLFLK